MRKTLWMTGMGMALLGAVVSSPKVGMARAQMQQVPSAQQSAPPSHLPSVPSIDGNKEGDIDPLVAMRQAQAARSQANERHKRIVDDADKLLALAVELKADVDKTNKNEMSLEVIRKADEIERLAHDAKQRMKG